jgi:Bacterial Ig-like domain (group 2)
MQHKERILARAGALAAFFLLTAGVGCTGFFVNPTLTTITITPTTPSIEQGTTQQMTATGTYDDGSTKTINSNISWSSSDTTIATVSTSGVVTGVSTGSASITATSGAVSGSTSITITIANLLSIAVTPTNPSISSGQTVQFTATGTVQGGGTVDITNSVTWASSDTTVAQISATGLATAQTVGTTSATSITATSGNIVSPAVTLTVNP